MIVLAGAVILALSNSNIIDKANKAKESYNMSSEKEEILSLLNEVKLEESLSQKGVWETFETSLEDKGYWVNDVETKFIVRKSETKYEIEKSSLELTKFEEDKWDGATIDTSIFEDYDNQTEFIIMTAAQLKGFAKVVNEDKKDFSGKTIKLGANIDMGARFTDAGKLLSGTEWTPINKFRGDFDGMGYTISGIYINKDEEYIGLFTNFDNQNIQNLGILYSYIEGKKYVGTFASLMSDDTTIVNCYNGSILKAEADAGGIIGVCSASSNSLIDRCYNLGSIEVSGNYAGGILGCDLYANTKITYSYNKGIISGSYAAGITGLKATIINCYNLANIYAYHGGGICASGGNIQNSYNKGNIIGNNNGAYNGGISRNGEVINCYNTGNVTGWLAGGIVAIHDSPTIHNCYNIGDVNYYGKGNRGAILGHTETELSELDIKNCYYLGIGNLKGVMASHDVEGTIKKDSDYMKSDEFVDKLNEGLEEKVWKKDTENINDGYPILIWQ